MPMRMAKLYFYYASMNAGKSTTLLQADFNYRERGMETMLFTAAVHDRGGAGVIDSRIGLSAPATPFAADTHLAALFAVRPAPGPIPFVLLHQPPFLPSPQFPPLPPPPHFFALPLSPSFLLPSFSLSLFP